MMKYQWRHCYRYDVILLLLQRVTNTHNGSEMYVQLINVMKLTAVVVRSLGTLQPVLLNGHGVD